MQNFSFHLMPAGPKKKELYDFQEDAGWPASDISLTKPVDPRARVQWVCVNQDKRRVAIARLELAPASFCFISELIIRSTFRRKGVGRWLLKNIEQLCLQLGIPRMLLVPDDSSLPFYQKLSFLPDPVIPGHLRKDVNPFQARLLRPVQAPA